MTDDAEAYPLFRDALESLRSVVADRSLAQPFADAVVVRWGAQRLIEFIPAWCNFAFGPPGYIEAAGRVVMSVNCGIDGKLMEADEAPAHVLWAGRFCVAWLNGDIEICQALLKVETDAVEWSLRAKEILSGIAGMREDRNYYERPDGLSPNARPIQSRRP